MYTYSVKSYDLKFLYVKKSFFSFFQKIPIFSISTSHSKIDILTQKTHKCNLQIINIMFLTGKSGL